MITKGSLVLAMAGTASAFSSEIPQRRKLLRTEMLCPLFPSQGSMVAAECVSCTHAPYHPHKMMATARIVDSGSALAWLSSHVLIAPPCLDLYNMTCAIFELSIPAVRNAFSGLAF